MEIFNYFTSIFDQKLSNESLKKQLDEILDSLVTDFDEEEIPLRKKEKLEELVIDFDGDENRANQNMKVETTALEEKRDFTQLLTDAAMKPETSHSSVSTQKFAIALSKDWISNAYEDIIAQNRMSIPYEIKINVDSYNGKTTDGQNEKEIVNEYNMLIDTETQNALSQHKMTGFGKFCLFGGIALGVVALITLIGQQIGLGLIAAIGAVGLIIAYFSKKKQIKDIRENIMLQFDQKRVNGIKIIKATLAEVVDFRIEFAQKDADSAKVTDFLEQITPEQYVRKLADSGRKVKI